MWYDKSVSFTVSGTCVRTYIQYSKLHIQTDSQRVSYTASRIYVGTVVNRVF